MILVTVGTQLPFERLIRAIDAIAPSLSEPVFAQIGQDSSYRPSNFEYCETMEPGTFDIRVRQASRIVSHAGIGTVLKAKEYRKPIILFPRRAAAGEHRNDHQMATCAQLEGRPGIFVAYDIAGLGRLLSQAFSDLSPQVLESAATYRDLISGLAKYIERQ